jgi:hypothetical protein
MPRLKDRYKEEIVPAMIKDFGYSNVHEVPGINKVVVNIGLGEALQNARALERAERNYKILGWASQRIEQLHPHPDSLSLESMSDEDLLREALQMSREYIALAEDGRGHNARSHYLARQLRGIQQYMVQDWQLANT